MSLNASVPPDFFSEERTTNRIIVRHFEIILINKQVWSLNVIVLKKEFFIFWCYSVATVCNYVKYRILNIQ
jgi:hypothetical protein